MAVRVKKVNWRTSEDPPFVRGGAILADGLPLALADGKLLIRDQKNLKCLVVGQPIRQRATRWDGRHGSPEAGGPAFDRMTA